MSVYLKDGAGNTKKLAGYITQRSNTRWFLCKRSLEDGVEYYDIPEEASTYFQGIEAYTLYAFGFNEPNTTTNPKLRLKDKVFDIYDFNAVGDTPVLSNQLQGVFEMFTQDLITDPKMYFTSSVNNRDSSTYDKLLNLPVLKTGNTESLEPTEEVFKDTINLHQISKTGKLADAIEDEEHVTINQELKDNLANAVKAYVDVDGYLHIDSLNAPPPPPSLENMSWADIKAAWDENQGETLELGDTKTFKMTDEAQTEISTRLVNKSSPRGLVFEMTVAFDKQYLYSEGNSTESGQRVYPSGSNFSQVLEPLFKQFPEDLVAVVNSITYNSYSTGESLSNWYFVSAKGLFAPAITDYIPHEIIESSFDTTTDLRNETKWKSNSGLVLGQFDYYKQLDMANVGRNVESEYLFKLPIDGEFENSTRNIFTRTVIYQESIGAFSHVHYRNVYIKINTDNKTGAPAMSPEYDPSLNDKYYLTACFRIGGEA